MLLIKLLHWLILEWIEHSQEQPFPAVFGSVPIVMYSFLQTLWREDGCERGCWHVLSNEPNNSSNPLGGSCTQTDNNPAFLCGFYPNCLTFSGSTVILCVTACWSLLTWEIVTSPNSYSIIIFPQDSAHNCIMIEDQLLNKVHSSTKKDNVFQ